MHMVERISVDDLMLESSSTKGHVVKKLRNYSKQTKDPLLRILSNIACMHIEQDDVPRIEEELFSFLKDAERLVEKQDREQLKKRCAQFIDGASEHG